MKWLAGNIYGSLSTVLRYQLHVWLHFPSLASCSGASLMKQWHSTHQRTNSLSTTRSPSSSSLARTTEWVKEACWEPAGKCVWAYVYVALYCKDCIHRISSVLSHSDDVFPLRLLKTRSSPLFAASVPPLPGVGVRGGRLPLCSALSRTCPPRGWDRRTSGAAHTERRPHLHPARAMTLTWSH